MSIQQYLDKIKNAVYGREVRGAIHDAIKQTYDDAAEGGDANMEVMLARGTFPNLNARLDNQYDKINDNNSLLSKKVDEVVYDKPSQTIRFFADGIVVDTIDITEASNQSVIENYIDSLVSDGLIEGVKLSNESVGNLELARKSVTPEKTSFVKKGKNLFNGYYEHGMVLLGPTNGTFTVAERDGGYTAVIKVKPNTTYYVSKEENSTDRFGIAGSSSYPKFGDELTEIFNGTMSLNGFRVDTSENTNYLVVYLSSSTEDKIPDKFQVEERSWRSSYESPNKVIVDFVDGSIDVTALKNVTPIGLLTGGHNNFNVDLLNKKITTIGSGGFINVGGNRYYLKDGDFSYNHISTNAVIVFFDPSTSDILFNTISGSIEDEFKNLPIIGQIRQTGNSCDFFGNYQINGQNVIPFTETKSGGKRFYIDDNLEGLYRASIEYESPWDITIDVVYNILDNLVSLYPNYITRTLLFNDTSGLPVYLYKFKPESVRVNGSSRELPKIPVTSTHGFEVPAIMGTTKFFEDLANNWENNDLLRTLRWNVEFDYVPTLNPYGFNTRERKNANGVDLARNFSAGWNQEGENGNPDSVYYAGPSPLSEVETQGYNEYINNNQDVLFAIDVHNYTNLEVSGTVLWAGSNKSNIRNYLGGYVTKMSSMVQQNYNIPVGYENKLLGLVQGATGGSLTNQWESVGVNASLLELVSDFSTNNTDVQEFSASAVGNLALAGLKNLI